MKMIGTLVVVKLYCLGYATAVDGSALQDSEPCDNGILCSAVFYRYPLSIMCALDLLIRIVIHYLSHTMNVVNIFQ